MSEETEVRGWKKHRALFSAGLDELKKDVERLKSMSEEERIEFLSQNQFWDNMTPEQEAEFEKAYKNGKTLR